MATQNKPATYSEIIGELEQLIARLEQSDVPLEEAIVTYERGSDLLKLAHERLLAAEQTVRVVAQESDSAGDKSNAKDGPEN